ncbi:cytoplasmic protein [Phyllobacterium leguminum]|uniref:Cytoplasmic protein n=1 Tax=Phyllobacterium leguminum TaxID=314237 RepID=A0A318T5J0_9HYPH|nr:cytoplasmic protein [Phyllobacterium leguminum]PYE88366.1 hypothetical protein C7477_1078 [Phyllobacterium leguminum]
MTSHHLAVEAQAFRTSKERQREDAMQRAALQILCGIDLESVLAARKDEKAAAIRRLERLIERERLKGTGGHWSYDLNRHIALKQAFDRIRATMSPA